MKKTLLAIALCLAAVQAQAQSYCSQLVYGAVLTAAQWQNCFQQKQDVLGYVPLNKGGDTMLGVLTLAPPTTYGSLHFTPGNAPTSPVNGDVWMTAGGLFVQSGDATIGPIVTAPVVSVFGRIGTVTAQTGDYSVAQITGAAPLASPNFSGTPTAPTPATADNSTTLATTAYVQANIGSLSVGQISGAAPLASPTFTGTPAAPTPATADNTTKLATTAYVQSNLSALQPLNLYIATTGNDANSCLSSGAACLTLARAGAVLEATGSAIPATINVAAGSYAGGATFLRSTATIQGAGSGSTIILDTGQNCSVIIAKYKANITVAGVNLQTTCASGSVLWGQAGATVQTGADVILGSAPVARVFIQDGTKFIANANFTMGPGNSSDAFLISGNSETRMFGAPPIITISGTPSFGAWVNCINNGTFKNGGAIIVNAASASVTSPYALSENCVYDQEQNTGDYWTTQGTLTGGAVYWNGGSTFVGNISGTTLTVTSITAGTATLAVGDQITGTSVPAYTQITAQLTGSPGSTGTYTLNNSATVASETMNYQSKYPCIDSIGICTTDHAAPTGLGTGGTAVVNNDSFGGDYGGTVTLTAGTSGMSSSGVLFIMPHSQMSYCTATPALGGSGTLTSVAINKGVTSGHFWIEIQWNGTLVASGTYKIMYNCR